jgi:hypothetical protein
MALSFMTAGCAHVKTDATQAKAAAKTDVEIQIAPFSTKTTAGLPEQWQPMIIHRSKKRTEYQLVTDNGSRVLHAHAAQASSGLMQKVNIDPMQQRELSWRWRIGGLVESADNRERALEDAPARINLGFDGDKDSLPFTDQILFETARVLTGQDFPYATLMYIRGRRAPVGTIIPNARSNRIKMIVVASGHEGIGEWHHFSRDIVADYERAFGEKPGRLIGVGVLTDTDNTGETVEAWYGDIRLAPR